YPGAVASANGSALAKVGSTNLFNFRSCLSRRLCIMAVEKVDFSLQETSLNIGSDRVSGGEKLTSSFDLVEKMEFLFVRIVRARDLPLKAVNGIIDPYLEIKIGNYNATTNTQAVHVFTDAWHLDSAIVSGKSLLNTRSKAYLSPRLWTRVSPDKNVNPQWNEDLMFVVAEPFFDSLIVTVEDRLKNNTVRCLGKCVIRLSNVEQRLLPLSVDPLWYILEDIVFEDGMEKEVNFFSKLNMCVSLNGGYHVFEESVHNGSDYRPTAKMLWTTMIGVLELGIINASGLQPMKLRDGCEMTDAYCVAKYGPKWVKTQTVVDSFDPKWNEQYSWDVYDLLSRNEPPLRQEVVGYMLDRGSQMWSLRKAKSNFQRVFATFKWFSNARQWFDEIRKWNNSAATVLVMAIYCIIVFKPDLILPTMTLYSIQVMILQWRKRSRRPTHIDVNLLIAGSMTAYELDEEFDTFSSSRQFDVLGMRYDRLRSIAGRVVTVISDTATQVERFHSLLNWRNPRITVMFLVCCLVGSFMLCYLISLKVLLIFGGFYVMRPPFLGKDVLNATHNFFSRLPTKADYML
ncbi:hypothetical protein Gotri_026378, partial [Gossypium trilobum]|nr:hypothetical protein [Gossypium trilobum]